jgi:hypothetical protein
MSSLQCHPFFVVNLRALVIALSVSCIFFATPESKAKAPVPFAYFNNLPSDGIGEESCSISLDLYQKLEQQTQQRISSYQNALIHNRPPAPLPGFKGDFQFFKRHPLEAALLIVPHSVIVELEKHYFKQDHPSGDGEGDAFRHFMAVALFTNIVGVTKAKAFMKFHERGDISMSSLMDRYNNLVAFSIVEQAFAKRKILPLRGIINRGLVAVKSGELYVYSPAGYPVRSEKVIAQSEARFKKWANNYLRFFIEE